MNAAYPVSEEFLYCDPECALDWISPCQQAHPCYACLLVDCHELAQDPRFATVSNPLKEKAHEPASN